MRQTEIKRLIETDRELATHAGTERDRERKRQRGIESGCNK